MTPLPSVCFIEDVCRELRISRRTLERLRRHGAFPIRELPSLDKRPRWSRDSLARYLEGQPQLSVRRRAIAMVHDGKGRGAA